MNQPDITICWNTPAEYKKLWYQANKEHCREYRRKHAYQAKYKKESIEKISAMIAEKQEQLEVLNRILQEKLVMTGM